MTEVPIDEAANTALLLEQHIKQKMALALSEFLFADSIGSKKTLDMAVESGQMALAAITAREQLIFQIVHTEQFKTNLRYLIRNIMQEEMEGMRRMVREEFAHGMIHNIHRSNTRA